MSVKHHITIFSTTTLLMLGVYTAFVGFFFFTYGAYTEKKVVSNQINTLINHLSHCCEQIKTNLSQITTRANYYTSFVILEQHKVA